MGTSITVDDVNTALYNKIIIASATNSASNKSKIIDYSIINGDFRVTLNGKYGISSVTTSSYFVIADAIAFYNDFDL